MLQKRDKGINNLERRRTLWW